MLVGSQKTITLIMIKFKWERKEDRKAEEREKHTHTRDRNTASGAREWRESYTSTVVRAHVYNRRLVIWKIAKEICINGKKCSFVFHLFISTFFREQERERERACARFIGAVRSKQKATRHIAHFVKATMRTMARSENKASHSLRQSFILFFCPVLARLPPAPLQLFY